MRRLAAYIVALALVLTALVAGPALAVNDPFTPADQCDAPQGEAIGHPAFEREQSDRASAPFSSNNPGRSDGAEGNRSAATAHCSNAQP